MYKVFTADRSIIFQGEADDIEPGGMLFYFGTADRHELKQAQVTFRKRSDASHLTIVGDSDEAWAEFSSYFVREKAAGGLVTDPSGDHLLLIHRRGRWDLPKGKVEDNETVEQAAIREVEEECGLSGPRIQKFIGATWHCYERKGQDHLKETCWFNMALSEHQEPVPQEEEDIVSTAWVPVDEVYDLVRGQTYPSIEEVLSFRVRA